MTAWQQGDKATAVSSFPATDWSARPLFATGSILSLSEVQLRALSAANRKAKADEMLPQLLSLRDLTEAVLQAGRDATSKGDNTQARKCFESLKQCGWIWDWGALPGRCVWVDFLVPRRPRFSSGGVFSGAACL